MKTSLIDILRFPRKRGNGLNPWYVILWRFSLVPFMLFFGAGFYLVGVLFHFGFYESEQFRKYWF